jgi:hypothetical protein
MAPRASSCAGLYSAAPDPYLGASSESRFRMRAELETMVDEIKQSLALLRRHL